MPKSDNLGTSLHAPPPTSSDAVTSACVPHDQYLYDSRYDEEAPHVRQSSEAQCIQLVRACKCSQTDDNVLISPDYTGRRGRHRYPSADVPARKYTETPIMYTIYSSMRIVFRS
jgi:hypothetical protein